MNLTEEDIQKFIEIWEREFGERLTPGEAHIEANNLLELASLIAQPLPGEPGSKGTLHTEP